MPICGIEIQYPLTSFDSYRDSLSFIEWETPINTDGGAYKFNAARQDKRGRYYYRTIKHRAMFKSLSLQVDEVQRSKGREFGNIEGTEYQLYISGSLHKSRYGHNYNMFTFSDLQAEIEEIEIALQLNPANAKINNIEAGVNLRFSSGLPPVILDNLLVCANETFTPYPNKKIGCYHAFTEYTLKVYNKALESNVPGNILRIEVHFDRMRKVKGLDITTLADLKDRAKVKRLSELLQEAWQHVLLFDRDLLCRAALKPKEITFLKICQFGQYWQREHERGISRAALKKKRDKLTALIRQHGRDYKTDIADEINRIWDNLFEEKKVNEIPECKIKTKKCSRLTVSPLR